MSLEDNILHTMIINILTTGQGPSSNEGRTDH